MTTKAWERKVPRSTQPGSGSRGAERPAASILTLVFVVGGLGALIALGRGQLAGPSDWSPDGLASWAADRDPVTAAMAILRLGALGAGAQVLLAGAVGALGGALHLSALVRLADLVTLPGMRGLVSRIAGLGLSASTLLNPAIANPAVTAAPAATVVTAVSSPTTGRMAPVVARRLPDAPHPGAPPTRAHTATLVRLADDPPPPGGGSATMVLIEPEPAEGPAPARTPAPPPHAPSTGVPASTTWLVRPGDHLWSISEATLTRAWSRAPGEREVDQYWRKVLRVNNQLADPDLIFPGQHVNLPPVPPA